MGTAGSGSHLRSCGLGATCGAASLQAAQALAGNDPVLRGSVDNRGVEARLSRGLSMRLRARLDRRLQARSIVASAPRVTRTAVMAPAHVPAPRGSAAPMRRRVFGIMVSLGRLTHRSEASCRDHTAGSRTRRPSVSVDNASFTNSSRQTGRSLRQPSRRRPHVERVARTSSASARRVATSRRPKRCAASAMTASPAGSRETVPSRPSLRRDRHDRGHASAGRARRAMPWATRSSAPSTPRSSEPHGNRIRTSSASPRSSMAGIRPRRRRTAGSNARPWPKTERRGATSRPSMPRRRRYR